MKEKYQFGFQIWGLIVFVIVMIPNFIWFAVPASNDILRTSSMTPRLDMVASIFQVIMVALLCIIKNKDANPMKISKWIILSGVCILLYYISWGLYYSGLTSPITILGLTVPPCLTFLFFAIDRENIIAVFPTIAFGICHLIYGIVNYIA
ncbi:MAG: hypothetical protein Q4B31_05515 [Clostridia bacterium]|nr:hypothetical protein [Clostridia bacterium]